MTNITIELKDVSLEDIATLNAMKQKYSEKPIKCEGGSYTVLSDGSVYVDAYDSSECVGNTYKTKELAEHAAKMRIEREVLNHHIRAENERTGFVARWGSYHKNKYAVAFSHNSGKWEVSSATNYQRVGVEYCNKESADKLADLLNRGMIFNIGAKPE